MGKRKKVVHRRRRNAKKQKINRLLIFAAVVVITFFIVLLINKALSRERLAKVYANRLDELPTHSYNFDCLAYDEPFWSYEDEDYYILNGIDVSVHQGEIDWKKVKDEGTDFVYIRMGYRGYSEGKLHIDDNFLENYEGARENGLMVGIYFFSQAITIDEAEEEAKFVLDNIKGMEFDLPIAFDYEDIDYDTSRMGKVSGEQRTKNAVAFVEYLLNKGKEASIYTNLAWTEKFYDLSLILKYDIWFAQFNKTPEFIHPFFIWQYSEKGKIDGIEKPVDLNMMFIKKY